MKPEEQKLTDNVLPTLLNKITIRASLKTILQRKFFGPGDMDELSRASTTKHDDVYTFVNIFTKKADGLVNLYSVLIEDDQTEAANIILKEANLKFKKLAVELKSVKIQGLESKRKAKEMSPVDPSPKRETVKKEKSEQSDIPKTDPYNLPRKGKGLVLAINIIEFDDPETTNRDSALYDNTSIRQLFPELGYDIFPADFEHKRRYTKKEILNLIEDFKEECKNKKAKSCIVFIGSHGEGENIGISDMEQIPVNFIISKFYNDKFQCMEGKPKMFIIQCCRNFVEGIDEVDEFSRFKADDKDGVKLQEEQDASNVPNADTIIIKSQLPGKPSYRRDKMGSILMHCVKKVFRKHASNVSVIKMMNMVVNKVTYEKSEQVPALTFLGPMTDYYLNVA